MNAATTSIRATDLTKPLFLVAAMDIAASDARDEYVCIDALTSVAREYWDWLDLGVRAEEVIAPLGSLQQDGYWTIVSSPNSDPQHGPLGVKLAEDVTRALPKLRKHLVERWFGRDPRGALADGAGAEGRVYPTQNGHATNGHVPVEVLERAELVPTVLGGAIAVINGAVRRRIVAPGGASRTYIFGSMSSAQIRDLTFVPSLTSTPKAYLLERTATGYQRSGSPRRIHAFAEWAKEHPTSLIPPVLISGRGGWHFQPADGVVGNLVIDDAAAIVDGQHRLGGLVCLLERHGIVRDIDFLLLPELTLAEEVQEFVVVNSSQVGVKRSLTTYLSRDENPAAWVAWELNERPDSPFAGRIARQRLEAGQLFTLEAVSVGVQRTFSSGAFAETAPAAKLDILLRYWDLIAKHHPEQWADIEQPRRSLFEYKLLETTGLVT